MDFEFIYMADYLFYILIVLSGSLILYWIFKKPLWVILGLLLLLPLHAFLLTSTKYFLALNSSQAAILAFWKEFILLGFFLKIICQSIISGKLPFKLTWYDYLLFGLLLLAILINYFKGIPTLMTFFGIRYDFLLFATYLIFRSLPIKDEEFLKILKAIFWGGGVVILFGILQKFLPADFLTHFGYARITDWNPQNTLDLPAYHFIHETGTQRLQSFFSGPNSLGSYLVILWGLSWFGLARSSFRKSFWFFATFIILIALLAFFTYSRAAWIVMLIFFGFFFLSLFKTMQIRILLGIFLISIGLLGFYGLRDNFSENLVRGDTSLSGHWVRGAAALYLMKNHPEGLGVGTAGPSSLRFTEKFTEIPPQAYPEIAGYLKKIHIQTNPASFAFVLTGPLVPENWFLQIGVELGILGLGMFLAIILGIYWAIYQIYLKTKNFLYSEFVLTVLFIGISLLIHSLFLHTWSDAPTTILFGALLGIVFSTNKEIFYGKTQNLRHKN